MVELRRLRRVGCRRDNFSHLSWASLFADRPGEAFRGRKIRESRWSLRCRRRLRARSSLLRRQLARSFRTCARGESEPRGTGIARAVRRERASTIRRPLRRPLQPDLPALRWRTETHRWLAKGEKDWWTFFSRW